MNSLSKGFKCSARALWNGGNFCLSKGKKDMTQLKRGKRGFFDYGIMKQVDVNLEEK